jgi:THO complex subunit 3
MRSHSSRSTSVEMELRHVHSKATHSGEKEHGKMTSSKFALEISDFTELSTRELRGHRARIHTLGWNIDGTRLASGSVDHTVRIWSTSRMSLVCELSDHTGSIDKLVWDPQHVDVVATASADKTVKLWDIRMGKSVHNINTSEENINLSWHPNGSTLAVGTKQDVVGFIDIKEVKLEKKIQYSYEVNEICWNRTGSLFLITTGLGHINVLEYPSLKSLHTVQAHTANCYTIDVSSNNEYDLKKFYVHLCFIIVFNLVIIRYVATGGADALIALWKPDDWICIRTLDHLE